MLHTVLTILSIIGIVLLCVLALLILLVMLILFLSIRYKINAIYHNNEYKVVARASWLFRAIQFKISFEKDYINKKLFVFGIPIKKKTNNETKSSHKKDKKKVVDNNEHSDEHDSITKDIAKEPNGKEPKVKVAEFKKQQESSSQKRNRKIKKKSNIFKRIKLKIQNIISQWNKIIDFIKNEDNKEVFIFAKLRFFEIISHLRPKKINGYMILGFEDPAVTGQVLGLIGLIFGFIGRGIQITPEFENKIIEIDITIKGRIRAFNLLRIVWKCYRNKKFKESFRQLVSLKD